MPASITSRRAEFAAFLLRGRMPGMRRYRAAFWCCAASCSLSLLHIAVAEVRWRAFALNFASDESIYFVGLDHRELMDRLLRRLMQYGPDPLSITLSVVVAVLSGVVAFMLLR